MVFARLPPVKCGKAFLKVPPPVELSIHSIGVAPQSNDSFIGSIQGTNTPAMNSNEYLNQT